ncbi:MAG: metallophosphoesterase family protein [Novosphingobium sp.]
MIDVRALWLNRPVCSDSQQAKIWRRSMQFFKGRFAKRSHVAAQVPDGQRVYAIGDIHGEAMLLNRLLVNIHKDLKTRASKQVTLVLLGDLIDRGPDSAVILRAMMAAEDMSVVVLKGNHEQALVHAYRGDDQALEFWMEYGGITTLRSFGINPDGLDYASLRAAMRQRIEPAIIEWMDSRPLHFSIGGYFFTHAGVRPGVPLEEQVEDDLLWIREPFLNSQRDHGKVVVHGHTIIAAPVELGGNSICIDTGGHEFGRLTALGLEGEQQWVVDAAEADLPESIPGYAGQGEAE